MSSALKFPHGMTQPSAKKEKSSYYSPLFVVYPLLFIPHGPTRASAFTTALQNALGMNLTLFLMCFCGNMLSVFQVICKWLWEHASHINEDSQQINKYEELATQTIHRLPVNFYFSLSLEKVEHLEKESPPIKTGVFAFLVYTVLIH